MGFPNWGEGVGPHIFPFFFFEDVSYATVASYIRNTGGAKKTCYAEEGLPNNIDHSEKQRKKLVTLFFPRWR